MWTKRRSRPRCGCQGPIVVAIAAVAGFAHTARADGPITTTNWMNHPTIVAVRSIFKEVEEARKASALHATCLTTSSEQWVLFQDGGSRPRLLRHVTGTEDRARIDELYYGVDGTLRFDFITMSGADGSSAEHRIYFSAVGERIWEVDKGKGVVTWPEADVQPARDPLARVKGGSTCDVARVVRTESDKPAAPIPGAVFPAIGTFDGNAARSFDKIFD